ncbi:NAD(P)-dependent oxidoreductase [Micromonospora sp. WMMD980]|uniref:NAD(P)-dependent oxidoreductase n=1 Tax=Micromonospora sp. WMMD980 TaxID=3016088 RepID=UPI00241604AC|nr:NAD(P)-dependent oxidoreductase [Micromonospora sp. WMMD980]MDG4800669.1 NAD(P)-dependent oxidoreductase [Micromonospora sp. WMMD980]
MTRVAVLGLGGMGTPMAASLLRAGLDTVVWNRHPEPARALAERGAVVAADPAEAVCRADVAVTMLTDGPAVRAVAADQGMLAALPAGAVWAQMSTIGVAETERLVELVSAERPDVTLVDAPVAGSRGPAEQGRLTVLASGPEQARERVAPVFDAVGQRTLWLGPAGAGSRLKLVNNLLLAFVNEGVAAAVALGDTLGLDRDTVRQALDGSPLVAPWAAEKLARVVRDEHGAQYPLALALKDVELALREAPAGSFPAAEALAAEWRRAADRGLGDDDLTVVTRMLGSDATRRP